MSKKSLLMMLLLALLVPWAASAQVSTPYTEGFENMSTASDLTDAGWISYQSHSGSFLAIEASSSNVHTGTKALKIDSWDAGSNSDYVILGLPTVDAAINTLQITFSYKISSSYGGNMEVGYLTNVGDASTFVSLQTCANSTSYATETVELNGAPNDAARIAIKYIGYYRCYVDDIEVKTIPTCLKPTGLNFALTPGDGTVATLSWTSDATAWQICLNGDETNLIAATTNPWQLTGLTPETTYTAKVRANCGSEQSDWSNEVTFTPTNAYALTVNDGTTTNGLVPIYGTWVDNITKSQFIIPARELADIAWGTINKMTFYAGADKDWGAAQFEVYMTETAETTLSALADYSTMTKVKNAGSLSISGNQMVVEFDTPYSYMGGNLMIGFLQTVSGTWSGCSWYGVTVEGASMGGYGSSVSQQNFLPKTTFGYTPGEAPACMWPTNFAVSNITARTADLSWTSDGNAWQIEYNGQTINVTQNSYTLTGLTPNTDYTVKVRTDCGADGYSDWTNPVSFTTDVLCHDPSNLIISDITAFSANASWTAETTSTLRYVAVNPDNLFFQGFVTDPGAMSNGADASWIKGESTLWGPGAQHNSGYMVADDFTVNAATTLAEIEVYGYQTGSTTESTFTGLYAMILSGNPMEGPVDTIWGDMNTNLMTSTSFTNCYRGSNNSPTATTRPVMAITASGLNINLAAGTYYLVYNMTGTLSSGPWVVPQSDPVLGNIGDSWQYSSSSGWYALEDDGSGPYGLAMKLTFGDIESFDWTTVNNISDGQYAMTNLNPATTYLVQVRVNCTEANSAWVSKTFTTLFSCLFPTDLVVNSIEARQAVLNWTENGDATEWEVEITGGNQTTTETTTVKPFTMVGLSPDTQYTVRVRSNCSDTESSEWSLPITFTTDVSCHTPTGLAISDITNISAVASWVYEGDVELQYRPDMAWRYYDNGTFGTSMGAGGTIYWGILLTPDMLPANQPLTHIAMYENENNANPTTISIYSGGDTAPGTLLYQEEVTPLAADDFHEITLAEPVTFDATQNLWIVCYNDADTYPAAGSADLTNPNGRWVSLDGEEWADINDYGYNYTWMLRAAFGYASPEWISVNNPASPQTITGLTPETNYSVRLRAVCGGDDGVSAWVTTNFTTDEACPAPTALAATPYANSAVVSWEGISESYTVSYRTAAYTQGFSEEFATSSAPTGWTMYTGLLSNVMEDPTALVSATYGWTFGTGNGVFDSHARCNIYSNYQRWLVTPAIEVPAGAEFSFDLALTAYSGTVAAPATTGTDDKFVVLVSTDNMATWTILRQWDNAGSEYVYNNIANTATGENVSFDFSAYAGQTVYVAFYGESTTSNADNNLHIDNVAIGTAMPAGEWQTANADEVPFSLIGLTAETDYEWKVQGDCGEYGLSEESVIASFTTTNDLCPVPTNLTVNAETLTATTADLSWNGSPDVESFTVRYRAPEHIVGGISEAFDANSIPTGWTRYSGLVNDVVAGTATLSTTTSGWLFNNTNVFGEYHAKVNIYGTTCKYWLVTPEVTPSNGTFTFDLALTDYGNADPIEDATAQADDRFVVLVYANEAWTILREWNNSGSDYVYNTIATEGEAVSIDLSAYVGQTVKIAFYGESTASGGDNDLHIDNVVIGNPQTIPATDWMTVENITDMNVTLTGLTPETPYEAQVKADCSDPEAWSTAVNFTTPKLTIVTQTIALSAGWNWVSFNKEITLDDLKAALVEAAPAETEITIKAKSQNTTYKPATGRWSGRLTWDLGQMYLIQVAGDCEISLQGFPVDPADHPVTVLGGGQYTYIAFPLEESMSLTNAFAGFALQGDKVKGKSSNAEYQRRWNGQLTTLEPGQGYMYLSAPTAANRPGFVFPSGASKAAAAPTTVQQPKKAASMSSFKLPHTTDFDLNIRK